MVLEIVNRESMAQDQTSSGTVSTPQGMAPGSSASPSPGLVGASTLASQHGATNTNSTPEQRAKWRERWQRRKDRILGKSSPPAGPPGSSGPGGAPVVGPGGAPGQTPQTPGPIPWTAAAVRPILAQGVPAVERLDIATLKNKAARLEDPDFVSMVERDAAWNPEAKRDLIDSGSECLAEVLNEMGVESIPPHWAKFGVSCATILAGRKVLASKLDELFERKYGKGSRPTQSTPPTAAEPVPA